MSSPFVLDDRRLLQFRALTEVSRALTYAVSVDEVLQLTVERAAELLETPTTALMLSGEDGLLTIRASIGLDPADNRGRPLNEDLHRILGVPSERFLGVPLVAGGEVTGILAVALREDMTSTADEREWLLSALADQAAVALEKTRLDERGRFRDRLIGIVSHDLRTPISAIMLGASLLLDDDLNERTIKTLTRIQSSAKRAARLVDDLLDYTQAHLGGGIRVERKPNDLLAIAGNLLDELEVAHPDDAFELTHTGDTTAEVDADRISQVLGNLVSNAVSYSAPNTPVRIEIRGEETSVTIAVHNMGVAIPPDRLRHIFEPMQQVSPGAGRNHSSVGLGLYIVDSIVASHRGSIRVDSSATDGTTFTFTIPKLTHHSALT